MKLEDPDEILPSSRKTFSAKMPSLRRRQRSVSAMLASRRLLFLRESKRYSSINWLIVGGTPNYSGG
jgi:hypothetical protein